MKKASLKIAFWAKENSRFAQTLIVLISFGLGTLFFVAGALLQGSWEIPAITPYFLLGLSLLLFFGYFRVGSSFLLKKICIALMFGDAFLLFGYFGYEQAFEASRENPWVWQSASTNFTARNSTATHWSEEIPNHRKMARRLIRQYKPLFKTYTNKHLKGARKLWAKILLTVAGAVVYLFVMAFVAALSCSASCSGFTTEAALIGWGGFFLATTGLVFLLIWIWNDKPRKNQSNEALTYKEIH
ncbi:hypothetical protein [Raineya sp.]|jgi:hypothetical protein